MARVPVYRKQNRQAAHREGARDVDQGRAERRISSPAFANRTPDPPAQQRSQAAAQTDLQDIQRRHSAVPCRAPAVRHPPSTPRIAIFAVVI